MTMSQTALSAHLAKGIAAMIGGLYIRHSLNAAPDPTTPTGLAKDHLDMQLKPFGALPTARDTDTP